MALGSPTHGIVAGFFAGGLVAAAGTVLVPQALQGVAGAVPLPRAATLWLWALAAPVSLAAGGLVAGRRLGKGRRGALAVGLGMLAAGLLRLGVFSDLEGLTGREDPILVTAFTFLAGLLGFGLAGAIAGAVLGLRSRRVGGVAAGFAAASLLGSPCLLAPFFAVRTGAESLVGPVFPQVALLCQTGAVVLPFLAAGAVLGRVLDADAP